MKRICITVALSVLAFEILSPATGLAAALTEVVVPSGLNPGAQYRIVFVTSATRVANSSDINVYNSFVDSAAHSPGSLLGALPVTWSAIASTPTVSAFDNIGGASSAPIYLPNGTLVANNTADLWDGTLARAISMTQTGGAPSFTTVWTGTAADGSIASGLGNGGNATYGRDDATNSGWIAIGTRAPTDLHFFGISSPITIPGVPEPSTLALGGIAIVGLLMVGRRRRSSSRGQ